MYMEAGRGNLLRRETPNAGTQNGIDAQAFTGEAGWQFSEEHSD